MSVGPINALLMERDVLLDKVKALEAKLERAIKEREWIIAWVRTTDPDTAEILAQRDDWHTTGDATELPPCGCERCDYPDCDCRERAAKYGAHS